MNDQDKLQRIKNLYETQPFGIAELELVISIAESLEDSETRDFYICTSAEWLALNGNLQDLKRAFSLAQSTNVPMDRHFALLAIASRYTREELHQDALNVLSAAKRSLEKIDKSSVIEWQQAQAWEEIADTYARLGESVLATEAVSMVIRWAGVGQLDESDRLNVKESTSILFALVKKLLQTGDLEGAAQVGEAIKSESWRLSALREIQAVKEGKS